MSTAESPQGTNGAKNRTRLRSRAGARRIGDLLIDRGAVTEDDVRRALVVQRGSGKPLVEALLEMGVVERGVLRETLAEQLDVPAIDLAVTAGDPTILDIVPKPKAFQLRVIPLFMIGSQLTVAMAEPNDLAKLDELRFITGKEILPVLALRDEIERHLTVYFGELEDLESGDGLEFETNGRATADAVELEEVTEDRPVVRLVNLILARAVDEGASDIHVEPQEKEIIIRYRVDGILHRKPYNLPAAIGSSLSSRLKILASLDIAERRVPQDGKVKVRFHGRRVDIRMSTFPTIHGEKIVMRLLDKEKQAFTLDNIGMGPDLGAAWRRLLARKEGILLVTGPTGSGKSSTLYASLQHLVSPEINIVTLEDPVEYEMGGISQGQVHKGAGFTFAAGLRSILRQDPDIILVGEIRDLETAQISIQAALTGHLVLSTLHTNDAPSAVARLVDMGVPRFLVSAGVLGVLAQRLVRRVCPHCVEDGEPEADRQEFFAPWIARGVPYRTASGCDRCGGVGFKGRVGVHELVVFNDAIRARLSAGDAAAPIIAEAARESGYRTMWWDGLDKVVEGHTTLGELSRSIHPDED
jgi:type IV pilus assembly protein PilB